MSGLTGLRADALGNPFVHDPILKAGQDPAGGIADALAIRATKGPLLVYYSTVADAPVQLGNTASGEAIYGDTIDVTDAKFLIVYVAFFLNEDGGAVTENANLSIGFEASGDGVSWYPVGVIDRTTLIAPATMFRDDTGLSAGALSTTGGLATAAMTQNAPLKEDMVPILPAVASAVAADVVIQKAYRFLCEFESYVRVVAVAIYTEPPDVVPPSLYMAAQKATG